MVGNDQKKITFIICPKLLGNFLSNCPNNLKHEDIFISAQNFWAEMKIIFNMYKVPIIIEQNKNSQNAKKCQASRFFRMPNFWGRNEENQHL